MAITSGYQRNTPQREFVPSVAFPPKSKPQLGGNQTKPAQAQTQVGGNQTKPEQNSSPNLNEELNHEASSATNNDTLQDGVMHDRGGTNTVHQKVNYVTKKKVSNSVIQIRDFPRDVMDIVRGVIPGGNSYVETLLAYIYVTCPTKFDIPPNIQAIVDNYMQDDPLTQVYKEIRLLREQLHNLELSAYQSTLASEYALFNELGLRNDKEKDPININYLETGVEDMHIALEECAKQLKKKDTIRHGRR